jgi:hypothetical protein
MFLLRTTRVPAPRAQFAHNPHTRPRGANFGYTPRRQGLRPEFSPPGSAEAGFSLSGGNGDLECL